MKQIIFLFLVLIASISYFTYENTLKLYNKTDSKTQDKIELKTNEKSDIKDIKTLPLEKEVFVENKEQETDILSKKIEKKEEISTNSTKEVAQIQNKKSNVKKPNLENLEQIAKKIEPKDEIKVEKNISKNSTLQVEINNILKKNKITFKRLSSNITDDSFIALKDISKLLKANKNAKIEVGGHTDAKGKDDVNKWVSQQRAKSVRKELIKLGISSKRISAVGYGESMPIVPNNKNGYAAENRRVEFKVIEE